MSRQNRITFQAEDLLAMFLLIAIYPILNFVSKMSDQSLNWPCGGIPQSANSMSLYLPTQFIYHVYFGVVCISDFESLHYVSQPRGTLTAGGALSTRLVFVEFRETQDSIDYVGLVVHYDYGCSPQTRLLSIYC